MNQIIEKFEHLPEFKELNLNDQKFYLDLKQKINEYKAELDRQEKFIFDQIHNGNITEDEVIILSDAYKNLLDQHDQSLLDLVTFQQIVEEQHSEFLKGVKKFFDNVGDQIRKVGDKVGDIKIGGKKLSDTRLARTLSDAQDAVKGEIAFRQSRWEEKGSPFRRAWNALKKVNPLSVVARNGALLAIKLNFRGLATKLASGVISENELIAKGFDRNKIPGGRAGFNKFAEGWVKFGGKKDALESAVRDGWNKKPLLGDSSFTGPTEFYAHGNSEIFHNVEPATMTAIASGMTLIGTLLATFSKAGGPNNPYGPNNTPADYQAGLNEGDFPQDETIFIDQNGNVVDKDGKPMQPEDDTILGIPPVYFYSGLGLLVLLGIAVTIKIVKSKK